MLRAYLRNRFSGVASRLVDPHQSASWRHAMISDEDTLTASVMERVAYLAPGVAWKLLSVACDPFGGDFFPSLPMKDPAWHFWPTWEPAPEDAHLTRVVPDVVLEFPDMVVVFEAELDGAHGADVWASLIRAAQAGPARSRRLMFVGLGGRSGEQRIETARQTREQLSLRSGDTVMMYQLAWERLTPAIEVLRRSGHLHQGQLEVLKDMEAALADRGYRARTSFSTLHTAAQAQRLRRDALPEWPRHPRARPRALGFARFDSEPIDSASSLLTHWKVRP